MALNYNTNLSVIAAHFAEALDAKVLKSALKEKIIENPYYPSLYSLTDTFRKYNIETEAYEVPAENLTKLDTPFVSYIQNNEGGSDFALVNKINENTVTYITDDHKSNTVSTERFKAMYKGYILIGEATANSGDPNYAAELTKARNASLKQYALYLSLGVLLAITAYLNIAGAGSGDMLMYFSITLLKITGVLITGLLLAFEIDKENTIVKNICSATKKTNCNAVLESSGAKIFGIGWSEIGFVYFASTLLVLLLPFTSLAGKATTISILNLLAAPYIIYSVYYQWKVVKQWCVLCLATQAVIFLELVWALLSYWTSSTTFTLSTSLLFSAVLAMGIPITLWIVVKPILQRAKDFRIYRAAYKRIQNNLEIFNNLLRQQPKAPEGYEHIGINIGNPDAQHTIVKICNPYCNPCAKAHPELEDLVKHNPNVKVKIIFMATNEQDDAAGKVARHLLAVANKGNASQTEKALDDWYLPKNKEYNTFYSKHPLTEEIDQQADHLQAMSDWCDKAAIAFTPTFFINGHQLPDGYTLKEIKEIL